MSVPVVEAARARARVNSRLTNQPLTSQGLMKQVVAQGGFALTSAQPASMRPEWDGRVRVQIAGKLDKNRYKVERLMNRSDGTTSASAMVTSKPARVEGPRKHSGSRGNSHESVERVRTDLIRALENKGRRNSKSRTQGSRRRAEADRIQSTVQ